MGWNIKGIGNPFNRSVRHENPIQKNNKKSAVTVPKMIQQEQPVPRPQPPALGQAVDARQFNQRWQAEVKRHQTSDPFNKIDQQKQALNQQFKQSSQQRGQERS